MEELDTVQELSCKVVDVLEGEGLILIVLEEVEDGGGEKFRDDADVPVVFEAVEQVNTVVSIVGILVSEELKHPHLDLACLLVLEHGTTATPVSTSPYQPAEDSHHFDGPFDPFHFVVRANDFPKRPLTEGPHDTIAPRQHSTLADDVVAILVLDRILRF